MFEFVKRNSFTMFTVWLCALIVSTTAVNATQGWAPLGRFLTDVNTVTSCSDTGSGLCRDATQTLVGMASTINEAFTWTAQQTNSSANPELFTADQSTGATGVAITAAGTGLLSPTVPEFGIEANNTTPGAASCPDTTTGSGNTEFAAYNASAPTHGLWVRCSGAVSIVSIAVPALAVTGSETVSSTLSATQLTVSGSTPQFTCSPVGGCEFDFAATSAPLLVIKPTATSGIGGVTNVQFDCGNSQSDCVNFLGNGGITELLGTFTNSAGDIIDTAGNLHLNGTANATGGLYTANAANVTGAKGIGVIDIGGTGSMYNDVSCALTTSSKAATMVNGTDCKVTIVSADIAGPFTITYPNAYITTAPDVQVTMGTNSTPVTVKSVIPGLSSVIITMSGSVVANDYFMMHVSGGK
jgi:hypothetical protein